MKKLFLIFLASFISNVALAQNANNKCADLLLDGKKAEYNACVKSVLDRAENVSKN